MNNVWQRSIQYISISNVGICFSFWLKFELKRVNFRAQTLMKARLKGAQTGHNLLKKKADALSIRFRSILKKIIDVIQTKK